MYDLNKRSYFTTLGELRLLLANYSDDTPVSVCGVIGSYLHFAEDDSYVTFDDEALDSDYDEWSLNDDDIEGQYALIMAEHEARLAVLAAEEGA